MSKSDKRDRARGLLVGLAVGDALGAPVEFDAPSEIAMRKDDLFALPGGGSFGWAPGEFTDDTQMALVLARHLVEHGGWLDRDRLASEFAAWAQDAADVGNQTRAVLDQVSRGVDWRAAISSLGPDAAGNGSLMRVAPVALVAPSRSTAAQLAREQSQVTHPNASCVDACAAYSSLLWDTLEGIVPTLEEISGYCCTKEIEAAVLAAAHRPAMSGWVVHTLAGAIWAVQGANGFDDAVWRAVSLGRDADTVGAVAGALAGARWGLNSIPESLSERLQSRHPSFLDEYPQALIGLADALADLNT